MTEGAKNIIRKDLKKYEQLVKYSDEENGKEYQKNS